MYSKENSWIAGSLSIILMLGILGLTMGRQVRATSVMTPTTTPLPDSLAIIETLNVLMADETCQLPCWWGWQFGEDSLEQVQATADRNLDEPLFTRLENDYIHLSRSLEVINYSIESALTARNPRLNLWVDIKSDQLVASHLSIEAPTASYVDFSPYIISEVLSKYGVPDEVSFFTNSLAFSMTIVLKYEASHYYFRYLLSYTLPLDGTFDFENDLLALCNTSENIPFFELSVNLIPDELDSPLTQYENIREFEGLSIDEITDLTAEEFTRIFSQRNQCFNTVPIREWEQKLAEISVNRAEEK